VLVKKSTCEPDTACVITPNGTAICMEWGKCTPGQESCSGTSALRCNENEATEVKETCTTEQACVLQAGIASCRDTCPPGEQQCSSGAVQTCGADRFWETTTECLVTQECVLFEGAASCRDLP
jgi:hypothetical protein